MIDTITSDAELDAFLESSGDRPVFLLKHSTTCPVSFEALRECQRFAESADRVGLRMIEIQRVRPLSQRITEMTGVRHESPQVLLFDQGEVVWNASHWDVTEKALRTAFADLAPE